MATLESRVIKLESSVDVTKLTREQVRALDVDRLTCEQRRALDASHLTSAQIQRIGLENLTDEQLKAVYDRRALADRMREDIQPDIDYAMAFRDYIGQPSTREQTESDLLESILMTIAVHDTKFADRDETPESIEECQLLAMMILDREYYGRESTMDEVKRERELARRIEADMQSGKPSSESEAAGQGRSHEARLERINTRSCALADWVAGGELSAYGDLLA